MTRGHREPVGDALADAILADPALAVSPKDAWALAACVRRVALRQPIMVDAEGKARGQHWPTRCFGLSCQIGHLEDRVAELEAQTKTPVARLVDKHLSRPRRTP
jgi:hypothetical protein